MFVWQNQYIRMSDLAHTLEQVLTPFLVVLFHLHRITNVLVLSFSGSRKDHQPIPVHLSKSMVRCSSCPKVPTPKNLNRNNNR